MTRAVVRSFVAEFNAVTAGEFRLPSLGIKFGLSLGVMAGPSTGLVSGVINFLYTVNIFNKLYFDLNIYYNIVVYGFNFVLIFIGY